MTKENILHTYTFSALNEQIASLCISSQTSVHAGHANLTTDLWLSCDPSGQATMTCSPDSKGFSISIQNALSGRWACIGMSLNLQATEKGKYLGLILETNSKMEIQVSPMLRYKFDDNTFKDIGTGSPLRFRTSEDTRIDLIPIDKGKISRSNSLELNFFIESDDCEMKIENLQILLGT